MPRIYLDNAATSWPKPESVYRAVDQYQREIGASVGRGSYSAAWRAREIVESTRDQLRALVHAPADAELVFAYSGTDALNVALHGYLRETCHVVTTVMEHNSVLRPLRWLAERYSIQISYADCDEFGLVTPENIRRLLEPATRLVVVSHASNVTGTIQPLTDIVDMLRRKRVPLLVDAAQTAGHLDIDLGALPVDMLATSGHKGLLGPLGTGVLFLSAAVAPEVASLRQGGTGSHSDDDHQPDRGSEKYEAGNLNAAGIAGLGAGLAYLAEHGAAVRRHEIELVTRLLDGLHELAGIRLLGPARASERVGVVSFVAPLDCHELANCLELSRGIQVRSGLMCAPRAHRALEASAGSLRVSVGPFNTSEEIDTLLMALRECLA